MVVVNLGQSPNYDVRISRTYIQCNNIPKWGREEVGEAVERGERSGMHPVSFRLHLVPVQKGAVLCQGCRAVAWSGT